MNETVLRMLKKSVDISNSSLVKNADGLLSKKPAKMEAVWIGQSKTHFPGNKYKVSH